MADDYAASTATTGVLSVGGTITGNIETTGDDDWFRITLTAGRTYQIDLAGGNPIPNPNLRVLNSAGSTLFSDTGFGQNAEVTFAPTASGTYYLSARAVFSDDPLGSYQLSTIDIGPATDDYAGSTATTGVLSVGGTITGNIETTGDDDWFRITLTAGRTYQIDLAGGNPIPNPNLRVLNSAGSTLFSDTGFGQNAEVTFAPTASGTYYLSARAVFSDDPLGSYQLSTIDIGPATDDYAGSTATTGVVNVGGTITGNIETTGDDDWFRITLTAGRTYQIDLAGGNPIPNPNLRVLNSAGSTLFSDTGFGQNAEVTFAPTASGTYYLSARAVFSDDPLGSYQLSTIDIGPATDDYAGSTATTGVLSVGGTITGNIETTGDDDWFRITLTAGRTYQIDLAGGNPIPNPNLRVLNSAGSTLFSDTGFGQNAEVTFAPTASGTYYLSARAVFSDDPLGSYQLSAVDLSANHQPTITSNGGGDGADVRVRGGNTAVTVVAATDSDPSNVLAYSIVGGADEAKFQINTSGTLSFITAPNFDAPSDANLDNRYIVHVGASDGELFDTQTLTVIVADQTASYDFNGDGNSDILWQHTNGAVTEWFMNGTSFSQTGLLGGNGDPDWRVVSGAGDFNGDGKADILWQHTSGAVNLWLMDGKDFSASGLIGGNGDPNWRIQATGDFNGDGKADIAWQHTNGDVCLWLRDGDHFDFGSVIGSNAGWQVAATGDLDGDGRDDILWQRADGAVRAWFMAGESYTATGLLGGSGDPHWDLRATGDFNGDGKSDIVWQNTSGAVCLWLMDGTSFTQSGLLGGRGDPSWQVKGTGDFNGDGKSDIVWQQVSGAVVTWQMDGFNFTQSGLLGGNGSASWDVIALA